MDGEARLKSTYFELEKACRLVSVQRDSERVCKILLELRGADERFDGAAEREADPNDGGRHIDNGFARAKR